MRGDAETQDFHEFISHFRDVMVEPVVDVVINDKGIYLIYNFINVIILQTHVAVLSIFDTCSILLETSPSA